MSTINEFGTIKSEKPAIKKLTLEAVCDSDISYPQLERIIKRLKKDFGNSECKIGLQDDIHVVLRQWENPMQKTLFEEYIAG